MTPENSLAKSLRTKAALESAWHIVRRNAQSPHTSKETKQAVKVFDLSSALGLDRIQRKLRSRSFTFGSQKGVLVKRPATKAGEKKAPRPLVVAPVENRIVQRAIHDVLIKLPPVAEILSTPYSYGGIKNKSREDAIWAAVKAVKSGSTWYLRSDIKDFFTKIPRSVVLAFVSDHVSDQEFLDLLGRATQTELENLDELGEFRKLFPFGDIGMAQGSALSLLMGNILLRDFDREMNRSGVTCIRYCDDFLLLGSSQKHVLWAFRGAQAKLEKFGMSAYDPFEENEKANIGETLKGFVFLGCQINGGLIQPSKKARAKFLDSLRLTYSDGKYAIKALLGATSSHKRFKQRFSQTVAKASHIMEGWGHAFRFCNGLQTMNAVSAEIVQMQTDFERFFKDALVGQPLDIRVRAMGLTLPEDVSTRAQTVRPSRPNPLLGPQAAHS